MSELHRITVNPEQCGGRPCIRGMRIRVTDVLDLLASGATREEILQDYPYLQSEDITASLELEARVRSCITTSPVVMISRHGTPPKN